MGSEISWGNQEAANKILDHATAQQLTQFHSTTLVLPDCTSHLSSGTLACKGKHLY